MKYRAFLSYKSDDRPWALKLLKALAARGIQDVFYDKNRLEAGDPWPAQLAEALAESQHLVLLQSQASSRPDSFATFEHWEFHGKYYDPAARNASLTPRRMVYVLLDANPPATVSMVHAISALKDAGGFVKGADQLADADPLWSSVVDQVVRAITKDDPGWPIGCFVLAASRADFEKIDFADRPADHESLDAAIGHLGLARKDFLDRYGQRPVDWTPFGAARPIGDILDQLRTRVNGALAASLNKEVAALQIRLEPVAETFWTSPEGAVSEIERWRNRLVAIVVDPLSLYVPRVVRRLNYVAELLTSGLATVMVLGARPAPPENGFLRDMLRVEAKALHGMLCDPQLPLADRQLLGGVNITDEHDLQRLLITTVGTIQRTDAISAQGRSSLLSMAPG